MHMPRAQRPQVLDLIAQLAPGQPLPAAALAERLGVGRMALSRLVAASGPQVVRMGSTRATAYALRRPTRAGSEWPLYRLREDATLEELGRVIALVGGGFHVDAGPDCPNLRRAPEGDVAAFFPVLPWYLDDLRPQGFLGRSFAHGRAQALGLPKDLKSWQPDDVLMALVTAGGTEAGDLLLGTAAVEAAMETLQVPIDRVAADDRLAQYRERARAALDGEDVGSSPGGEQPKFTATVEAYGRRRSVLVKFAQPDEGAAASAGAICWSANIWRLRPCASPDKPRRPANCCSRPRTPSWKSSASTARPICWGGEAWSRCCRYRLRSPARSPQRGRLQAPNCVIKAG